MKIFSVFSILGVLYCVTETMSFHNFHLLQGIKNKYVNFFDQNIDTKIYDESMNLYISRRKVIENNKDLYVKGMNSLKSILKLIEKDAKIEIEGISILPDRILIKWIYFCKMNIKIYGTSLYKFGKENKKINEHTLQITNINVPRDIYFYLHPNLWRPIKIK